MTPEERFPSFKDTTQPLKVRLEGDVTKQRVPGAEGKVKWKSLGSSNQGPTSVTKDTKFVHKLEVKD